MISIVLFSVFIITVFFGLPIGLCLGIAAITVIDFVSGAPSSSLIIKSMVMGGNNFPLVAIPMFILAGDIMKSGGLSRRIIASAAVLVGGLKSGLAYVNVLASMFFAAISGSSPATVAAIGSNLIPEMEKRGYPRDFSTALTAASGMLGVMIPPSIPFIIYGVAANESIGELFMAGILPGMLFAFFYALVARYLTRNMEINNSKEMTIEVEDDPSKKKRSNLWALLVPIIILGGIYGGIFTPTEAAGVAVAYALFVSLFVYKELKFKQLPDLFARTSMTSAISLVMVIMAFAFGRLLTIEQVPTTVADFITSLSDNKFVIIALINIMLLIVGMFMETVAAIIILTPILLPIVTAVGVSPIQFGVILTCNLAIGFCTPPLGANLFIASSIAHIELEKVIKAILPFLVSMIISLLLISYIPAISLTLPNLFK